MNRRGFFAALASLPFVPKALAAPKVFTFTVTQNFHRDSTLLSGFPDERARYRHDLQEAFNRRVDQDIFRELVKAWEQ